MCVVARAWRKNARGGGCLMMVVVSRLVEQHVVKMVGTATATIKHTHKTTSALRAQHVLGVELRCLQFLAQVRGRLEEPAALPRFYFSLACFHGEPTGLNDGLLGGARSGPVAMSDSGTSEEGTNARRPPSREPHNEFILVLEALAAATDASTERADSLQGYVRLLEIENEKLRRKNVAALSAASWRRTHRRGCALTAVRATATHGGKTSPSETQLPGRANQTNVVWSIAILQYYCACHANRNVI